MDNNLNIDWQKCGGMVPCITQDAATGEVLMLAYMDETALNLSIETGYAYYFSRSKNRIWKKGEESGNTQKIEKIWLDCDNDTILIKVEQKGVACHTGEKSCFFKEIAKGEILSHATHQNAPKYDILDEIYHIIQDRKLNAEPSTSYVAKLFAKGENAILKKICEEAGEFAFACKDLSKAQKYANFALETFGEHEKGNPSKDVVYEGADLIFHLLVALAMHNISPKQLLEELQRREGISGIDEKNSRPKD